MSVRSRVAFASGAAGAVGAALVLSGRFDGSVVLALFLAFAIRTSAAGAMTDAGPILAAGALRLLRLRAALAPVWALVVAVAILRAGSAGLADARGANAVAGLPLAHGPLATVAGAWLAFAAALLAISATVRLGAETAAPPGASARVAIPVALRRLTASGVVAEAVLVVSLFLGPHIDGPSDVVWWVAGSALTLGFVVLAGRREAATERTAPAAATVLAAAGLALVLIGGPP